MKEIDQLTKLGVSNKSDYKYECTYDWSLIITTIGVILGLALWSFLLGCLFLWAVEIHGSFNAIGSFFGVISFITLMCNSRFQTFILNKDNLTKFTKIIGFFLLTSVVVLNIRVFGFDMVLQQVPGSGPYENYKQMALINLLTLGASGYVLNLKYDWTTKLLDKYCKEVE